jgi:hypothetical protein
MPKITLEQKIEKLIGQPIEVHEPGRASINYRFLFKKNADKANFAMSNISDWMFHSTSQLGDWKGGKNDRIELLHFDVDSYSTIPEKAFDTPIGSIYREYNDKTPKQLLAEAIAADKKETADFQNATNKLVSDIQSEGVNIKLADGKNEKAKDIVITFDNWGDARRVYQELYDRADYAHASIYDYPTINKNGQGNFEVSINSLDLVRLQNRNPTRTYDKRNPDNPNWFADLNKEVHKSAIETANEMNPEMKALEAKLGLAQYGLKIEQEADKYYIRGLDNYGQAPNLVGDLNLIMADHKAYGDFAKEIRLPGDKREILLDESFLRRKPVRHFSVADTMLFDNFQTTKNENDIGGFKKTSEEALAKIKEKTSSTLDVASQVSARVDKAASEYEGSRELLVKAERKLEIAKLEVDRLQKEEGLLVKKAELKDDDSKKENKEGVTQFISDPPVDVGAQKTEADKDKNTKESPDDKTAREAQAKARDEATVALEETRIKLSRAEQSRLEAEANFETIKSLRQKESSQLDALREQLKIATDNAKRAEQTLKAASDAHAKFKKGVTYSDAQMASDEVAKALVITSKCETQANAALATCEKITPVTYYTAERDNQQPATTDSPAQQANPATGTPKTEAPAQAAPQTPAAQPAVPAPPAAASAAPAPSADPAAPAVAPAIDASTAPTPPVAPVIPNAGEIVAVAGQSNLINDNKYGMLAGLGGILALIFMGVDPIMAAIGAVVMAAAASFIGDGAKGILGDLLPSNMIGAKQPAQGLAVLVEKGSEPAKDYSVTFDANGKITDVGTAAYALDGTVDKEKLLFQPNKVSVKGGDASLQGRKIEHADPIPVVKVEKDGIVQYVVPTDTDLSAIAQKLNEAAWTAAAPRTAEGAVITSLKLLDADKNNQVSKDELAVLDADKDGVLRANELKRLDKAEHSKLFDAMLKDAQNKPAYNAPQGEINLGSMQVPVNLPREPEAAPPALPGK